MYHTYIAIPSPKQKGKSNGSTNYFVSGAALSWKDEASFDGADVVDGDAEPEVRDDLHTAQVGGGGQKHATHHHNLLYTTVRERDKHQQQG